MRFDVDIAVPRTRFARGAIADLTGELARLGIARAILLSTPEQAEQARAIAAAADDLIVLHHPHAVIHTPTTVSQTAVAAARAAQADGIVAIGGGSTINLGKAIALRTRLPILAIPTTFAGSEMTPILGETEDGEKRTLRDPVVLPRTVLYDPALVETMPANLSGPSGLNAVAHAAEALYAENANPIVDHWAGEAVSALAAALPDFPHSAERGLYGAWLAGALSPEGPERFAGMVSTSAGS